MDQTLRTRRWSHWSNGWYYLGWGRVTRHWSLGWMRRIWWSLGSWSAGLGGFCYCVASCSSFRCSWSERKPTHGLSPCAACSYSPACSHTGKGGTGIWTSRVMKSACHWCGDLALSRLASHSHGICSCSGYTSMACCGSSHVCCSLKLAMILCSGLGLAVR